MTRHIVDKFTISTQSRFDIESLCGKLISVTVNTSNVESSAHVVDWRWRTFPSQKDGTRKNLCSECLKECDRNWYRMQRKRKIPPVSIRNCRSILRSIRSDISKTDDLEVWAKLGEELRVTSNRFYKTVVPDLLYKKQMGRCALCQEHQRNPKNMALDHIVPRAKGGASSLDNLQLACRACNEEKGDRDNEWFISHLRRQGRLTDIERTDG